LGRRTQHGLYTYEYLRRIDPARAANNEPTGQSSLLLAFFALCGAAIVATHRTRTTSPPAARALYSIVNRQIAAFRTADFDTAYRHAATGVQQNFSRAQFELMIRRDFSPMTEAQHVEFGAISVAGATALVQVFLRAPDGAVRAFLYNFTAEADGWKINGAQPLGPQPVRHLPGVHI
jgi:hypothetical protein